MSDILEQAQKLLKEKFANSSMDETVKFVIDGAGSLFAKDGEVSQSDEDADVTLTAPADVFQDILSGDLDGASAFMSGKLKVDGDMGLAMKLSSILA